MDKAVVLRGEIDAAAEGFAALVAVYEERMRAASPGAEFAPDWESPADAVSTYLNVEFAHLTRALECLKTCDSDEHAAALGDAMGEGFLKLDKIVAEGWARFGIVPSRDFRRTALIVNSVFKPGAFREKGTPSVFGGRVDSVVFRRMALINEVFKSLTPHQRTILSYRFGLYGHPWLDTKEVAKLYGVTVGRIMQIEARALQRLRHPTRVRILGDLRADEDSLVEKAGDPFRPTGRVENWGHLAESLAIDETERDALPLSVNLVHYWRWIIRSKE